MTKAWMAALALAAGPVAAQETNGAAEMMRSLGGGISREALAAAIEKARTSPLGSRENPVRADMPQGQRAYLSRLRCADGAAPRFERTGNLGPGVFGYIIDAYSVRCGDQPAVTVIMDMYHRHVETAAVPGFTIVPPEGAAPVPPTAAPTPAPTATPAPSGPTI